MNKLDDSRLIGMLRRVLRDCGNLYRQSGELMVRRYPKQLESRVERFEELMEDLHRGLLIKVYVTIVRADDRWTLQEKQVAAAMIEHLWGEELHGKELREAATGLFQHADQLNWESLVAPFVRYAPLADSKSQVETIVMRLANLVAKCDGQTMPEESAALHKLQRDMDTALYPTHPESTSAALDHLAAGGAAQAKQYKKQSASQAVDDQADPEEDREERLRVALRDLESLIGLEEVKERVKSYTNFLRLQQQRSKAGLSTMPISLHMNFVGNPGTGKTTVARIIGQILGALGTLQSGHVIETDRSGLVAEFAGQTAPKTNKLCDSALGGVLFIDEAYSLIDSSGDDAYGREAIQTLLKRMEDDRSSMAVILAGYSDEMENMIRSNPGLSSRINTTIDFHDYSPSNLAMIFQRMCQQNEYEMPPSARHRVLLGFHHLFQKRDRHFGNGRLARNAFENSVRRLADRIADVTELSESLLTSLTAEDISMPGIESERLTQIIDQQHILRVQCEGCGRRIRISPESLGLQIKCNRCNRVQSHDWADVHGS